MVVEIGLAGYGKSRPTTQPAKSRYTDHALPAGLLLVMCYINFKNARKAVTNRSYIHKGHKKILISENIFTIYSQLFFLMSN